MRFVALHGIGGAQNLPIPAALAIAGAVAALVISFTVLIVAWRTPRYDVRTAGRPLPDSVAAVIDSPALRWTLRILGLIGSGYLTWALVAGRDVVTNPVFGSFYVLLWVGIVPASLLCGPAFRLVSPIRTLHLIMARITGVPPERGVWAYPAWLGYWPAALGLFAFVWEELVDDRSTYLGSIRLWLGCYAVIAMAGALLFGEKWLRRADPFEVYSTLVGRLSPLGRRPDGVLVLRSPLAGLDGTKVAPGLVAVLAVLFGSTAFDSYHDNLSWLRFVDDSGIDPELLNSGALAAMCVLVAITFSAAAMTTGLHSDTPRNAMPGLLVHSLVPIVVGYMTAHYLSYFVEQGQRTVIQLSDPLGRGDNLLGTANLTVNYWLSKHPSLLANSKVIAIVAGHILAAVAAHDRALRLLPTRHQITGQLAMLLVMVAYTGTGLYLLFGA